MKKTKQLIERKLYKSCFSRPDNFKWQSAKRTFKESTG